MKLFLYGGSSFFVLCVLCTSVVVITHYPELSVEWLGRVDRTHNWWYDEQHLQTSSDQEGP